MDKLTKPSTITLQRFPTWPLSDCVCLRCLIDTYTFFVNIYSSNSDQCKQGGCRSPSPSPMMCDIETGGFCWCCNSSDIIYTLNTKHIPRRRDCCGYFIHAHSHHHGCLVCKTIKKPPQHFVRSRIENVETFPRGVLSLKHSSSLVARRTHPRQSASQSELGSVLEFKTIIISLVLIIIIVGVVVVSLIWSHVCVSVCEPNNS